MPLCFKTFKHFSSFLPFLPPVPCSSRPRAFVLPPPKKTNTSSHVDTNNCVQRVNGNFKCSRRLKRIYTRLSLNPARPTAQMHRRLPPPRRVCARVNGGDREQVTERHRLESRLGRDSTSCEEPRCSTLSPAKMSFNRYHSFPWFVQLPRTTLTTRTRVKFVQGRGGWMRNEPLDTIAT